jgi:plastocyanin
MVTVTIMDGGTFEPSELTLAAGDFVVFVNRDSAPHQPAPVEQAADTWMADPLPPFLDGQPAATSPALTFDGFTTGDSISYADGLTTDSGRPTGKINF